MSPYNMSLHLIVLHEIYVYSATLYKISMHFTSSLPGYGACSSQYQLNFLGSISPCCHHGAGDCSNTQAITVQPGTHSLLGRESAHTGEVSYPGTQSQNPTAKTYTQDVLILSRRSQSPTRDALHLWSIYFSCGDTYSGHWCLEFLAARELVALSGSFTSYSMSVRQHHHLRSHANHERYTGSNGEGARNKFHKPLPRTEGIEPCTGRRVTGKRANTCDIVRFKINK